MKLSQKIAAGLALSTLLATSAFAQNAAPAAPADAPAAMPAQGDRAKPGHDMKDRKGGMKGMKRHEGGRHGGKKHGGRGGHDGKGGQKMGHKDGMSPSATAKKLADPNNQGGNN